MKAHLLLLALTILIILPVAAITAQAQTGILFTVNHAGDTNDASVGDGFCADAGGNCTLRAAIEEANASPSQDAINFALPSPSVINLTLGELVISSNIYIAGPGPRNLSVQRSSNSGTAAFRIFRILPAGNIPQPTTIRGMAIKNGSTTSDGAAIFIDYQATLHLTEVTVSNNQAAGSGAVFNAGTLFLTRSLIRSNTAGGLFAGGIVNINDQTTSIISNSTLTENVGVQGGAVYNSGSFLLINNTFSHNSATSGGASIFNHSKGTISVLNTIVGMDNANGASSLAGAFNSLGHNLITDARNSSGFTNGVNNDQVSDNNAINPLLGELADNGGQTDTRALLDGSPALERGNNCVYTNDCSAPVPQFFRLSYDQRTGYSRSGGNAVDIGAFERQTGAFNASAAIGSRGAGNRWNGTLLVLTDALTNEKQYRATNFSGVYTFRNLDLKKVYILERKSKRAGLSSLQILDFDRLFLPVPFPKSPLEYEGLDVDLAR